MAVGLFDVFVEGARKDFRHMLDNFQDCRNDKRFRDYLAEQFERCSSKFEEDTLIENLAEEYKEYLKKVAETSGE